MVKLNYLCYVLMAAVLSGCEPELFAGGASVGGSGKPGGSHSAVDDADIGALEGEGRRHGIALNAVVLAPPAQAEGFTDGPDGDIGASFMPDAQDARVVELDVLGIARAHLARYGSLGHEQARLTALQRTTRKASQGHAGGGRLRTCQTAGGLLSLAGFVSVALPPKREHARISGVKNTALTARHTGLTRGSQASIRQAMTPGPRRQGWRTARELCEHDANFL